MQDMFIRLLSLIRNCIQSEGELRFRVSLYEIFVNLDFRFFNETFRNSTEEYYPQTNKWREVGKINIK